MRAFEKTLLSCLSLKPNERPSIDDLKEALGMPTVSTY